jgi:hypothetical protein
MDFFGELVMNLRRSVCFASVLMISITPGALHADTSAAAADDANPHLWQPRTKSVAVFKNGFGFFLREGSVELRDGWAVAKQIPPAKFGTLAVYSVKPDELVDVVGSGPGEVVEFDGVDAPKEIDQKRARLQAALRLNVQLTYKHEGKEQTATGKLVSIGPDFAVLEGSGSNFAVPVDGVTKMQVLELPLRIHVARDGQAAGQESARKTDIGMAYLRDGITWIPEYSLRILDDNTAELSLRGTLVNEAEDLIHCDVNFVVGVPHFVHTEFMEPIAVGQVIRTIGAAVAPNDIRSQIMNRAGIVRNSNAENQFGNQNEPNVVDEAMPSEGSLAEKLGNLPQLDTASGSDYTVYTKKDLTIRKGERAIVSLFVKKIHYSHIYRWSPPELMQHFLVLENNTDTAWTTGPLLATSGDQPLSEDLLKYTPKGGHCEVPVTASVNVAHEKTESEVDRKFKAHSPSRDLFFDLVTLDGELKLKNFEKREAEIVIDNLVPGRPVSASDDATLRADPTKLKLLEREGTIRWSLKLKPGETKELKYKYERYVPSN